MDKVQISQAGLRKRKMLLVLPVIVIPFVTLAFKALGGGKDRSNERGSTISGLNVTVPDPKLKGKTPLDKLGFYDQADKDSLKLLEEMKNDPYYRAQIERKQAESFDSLHIPGDNPEDVFPSPGKNMLRTSVNDNNASDAENKLMKKLSELNKVIGQSSKTPDHEKKLMLRDTDDAMPKLSYGDESDPELDKLSSMMDKIIDIQHPDKLRESIPNRSTNKNVFAVRTTYDTTVHGFYSLNEPEDTSVSNAITAVVHDNQVIQNGSVIRLRLTADAYINSVKIPAGNFVYGIATPEGERLQISIHSLRVNNSIYPVQMDVYDMDGLTGIYIPGVLTHDVLKQSTDNSLQLLQLSSLDPSLKAQATAAGVGTLKNLLSKKVKQVKVFLKEGYKVLLQNRQ